MNQNQTDLFGEPIARHCFEQDALGFLINYAKRAAGPFSSEDVTLAAREGYIRRSDVLFPRSMGNGSLAPGWVGC